MFYSRLAEFIAAQTRASSVADLQRPQPKVKKRFVALNDLAVMRDEAIERVLDNPDNYVGQIKMAIGEKVTVVGKVGKRSKLLDLMTSKRATLFVAAVHRISPWWKSLCDDVETRLGTGTMAVGVMTPGNKPGLLIHWDEGAVTAIQLAGKKQWYLWEPVVELSEVCNVRPLTPAELRRSPTMVVTLEPGDVLYVPRGWVHRAVTKSSEPSIHVSIGIIHSDMRGRQRSDLV